MKKIFTILVLLLFFSCEADFNEINDSNQRHVTLSFDTKEYFDNILVADGDDYIIGNFTDIDGNWRVRYIVYCYDEKGVLIEKKEMLSKCGDSCSITIRHLYKEKTYKFVIVSDVVELYTDNEYNEVWLHLNNNLLSTLRISSFMQDPNPGRNIVKNQIIDINPSNQTISVTPSDVTLNGYIEFINLQNIDKIKGWIRKYSSLVISKHSGINIATLNNYLYYPELDNPYVLPVTCLDVDNDLLFSIKKTALGDNDSVGLSINVSNHRPFVAHVDCNTLKLSNITYY